MPKVSSVLPLRLSALQYWEEEKRSPLRQDLGRRANGKEQPGAAWGGKPFLLPGTQESRWRLKASLSALTGTNKALYSRSLCLGFYLTNRQTFSFLHGLGQSETSVRWALMAASTSVWVTERRPTTAIVSLATPWMTTRRRAQVKMGPLGRFRSRKKINVGGTTFFFLIYHIELLSSSATQSTFCNFIPFSSLIFLSN